ncbi:MAG: alkaline phosphatase family protein [Acidobacteriota bacterium]
MQKRATLLAFLLPLALLACRREPVTHLKVVLIGLDGASWNMLDPLLKEGALPHLDDVRRRGVTADLQTVEPVDSPTNWTTIATGRRPEIHGVTNFFATSDFILVPTVWERLAERGVKVGLYDYLVTWPPKTLRGGFMIPGWTRLDDSVTPPDVFSRAGVSPYSYSVERLAIPGSAVANAHRELAEKPERWNRLAEAFSIDVGAVTFYSIDLISHRFWRASHPDEFPQGSPPIDPRQRGVMRDILQEVDRAVGRITETLGPETAVLLVSDHGFHAAPEGVSRRWGFHLHNWFALAGLDPERDRFRVVNDWQLVILRVDPGPDAEAVLGRLRDLFASATDAAGAPLLKVDTLRTGALKTDLKKGMPDLFVELAQRSPEAYGFLLARPANWQMLERLCPQGQVMTSKGSAPCSALAHVEEFSGAHLPTAVFFGAGGPIQHREQRGRMHMLDLAPLLFYLAGQPIPDDLEGRLAKEILSPDALRSHPPQTIKATAPRPRGKAGPAPEDPELLRRLRSLGYAN